MQRKIGKSPGRINMMSIWGELHVNYSIWRQGPCFLVYGLIAGMDEQIFRVSGIDTGQTSDFETWTSGGQQRTLQRTVQARGIGDWVSA